jgi:hypothetical protein
VVELSLSSFFRRGYGSAYDAIAHFFQASDPEKAIAEQRAWEQKLLRLKVAYLSPPQHRRFWLIGTDAVSIQRLFAHTLEDRAFVYQPNVPGRNKPITIGHQYSAQVVYPEKDQPDDSPWVVPLSMRRIRYPTELAFYTLDSLKGDQGDKQASMV